MELTKEQVQRLHEKLERLQIASRELYFSAYWHPDRPVDEAALWTELRDAAGITPGQTFAMLGEDRSK